MTTKRRLTEDEIRYITDWLDTASFIPNAGSNYSLTPQIASDLAKSYRSTFARQLRKEVVDPAKINLLKERMIEQFRKALVSPGYPAGKIAGTSAGEITSQLTLKAGKGQLGSSATGKTVDMMKRFDNLINVSRKPAQQRIEIYFKKRHTLFDLYLKRRLYQSVFIVPDRIEFSASNVLFSDWYNLFYQVYPEEEITANVGMRLHFSTPFLYGHQITLFEIAKRITNEVPFVIVVFSPQELGLIDVYPKTGFRSIIARFTPLKSESFNETGFGEISFEPIEEIISEEELEPSGSEEILEPEVENIVAIIEPSQVAIDEETDVNNFEEELYFLRTEVLPIITKLEFGFNPLIPVVGMDWTRVDAIIQSERKVDDNNYLLILSKRVIVERGITIDQFETLLSKVGWKVGICQNYRMTATRETGETSPQIDLRKYCENPQFFLETMVPFLTATTGFDILISQPGVDISRSRTDSGYLMKKFFGVEATYQTFFNEMNEIFTGDQRLSDINKTVICASMCFTGEPLSIKRLGIGKHGGPLSRASFEKQYQVIRDEAVFPTYESLTVSNSFFLGRLAPLGTGIFDIIPKKESLPQIPSVVQEDKSVFEAIFSKAEEPATSEIEDFTGFEIVPVIQPQPTPTVPISTAQSLASFRQLMDIGPTIPGVGNLPQRAQVSQPGIFATPKGEVKIEVEKPVLKKLRNNILF